MIAFLEATFLVYIIMPTFCTLFAWIMVSISKFINKEKFWNEEMRLCNEEHEEDLIEWDNRFHCGRRR